MVYQHLLPALSAQRFFPVSRPIRQLDVRGHRHRLARRLPHELQHPADFLGPDGRQPAGASPALCPSFRGAAAPFPGLGTKLLPSPGGLLPPFRLSGSHDRHALPFPGLGLGDFRDSLDSAEPVVALQLHKGCGFASQPALAGDPGSCRLPGRLHAPPRGQSPGGTTNTICSPPSCRKCMV